MFWDGPADGSGVGDASLAEYDAATEFSEVMKSISGSGARTNKGGVFFGEGNNLAVTSVGTSPVSVDTGAAICWGTWYKNTASVNIAIPTPGGATRIDRIVLRKSWSAQTVRAVRVAGTEGGGAPALTQTIGSTWEIPLAQVSITTGGTITITDQRETGSILGSTVPSKIKFDVAGTAGVSSEAPHGDHVHEIDDPAIPSALAFNDAASAGSGTDPAREDHIHAGPKVHIKYQVNDAATATGLTFPVLNGETYIFEGIVFYDTGTDDLGLAMTIPGGTIQWGYIGPDPTTLTTLIEGQSVTSGGVVTFGAEGPDHGVHFKGSFTAGANGNFAVTASGAGITIKRHSYVFAAKVN